MEQYRNNPNVRIHQMEDTHDGYEDYDYDDGYDYEDPPHGRSGMSMSRGGQSYSRVHPENGGPPPGMAQGLNAPEADKSTPLVDFDAFTSDAEKLSAILKCADVECHKHGLSADYYRFRKLALLAPVVFFSLFIAVAGFIAASRVVQGSRVGDSTAAEFLTLLVSSMAFVVLILTLLGNNLDYNSRVRFHTAAAEDLARLCEKVRTYRMERAMDERAREEREELEEMEEESESSSSEEEEESEEEDLPDTQEIVAHNGNQLARAARQEVREKIRATKASQKQNKKLTKTLVKQRVAQVREEQELSKDVITFYGYHTELHSIIAGCRDEVPPMIAKFYHVMENRVELMSLSRLGVEEESMMRKNQIVRLCATEIYNDISTYPLWPLSVPSVDSTVEGALKRVGQLLNMNYRARRRCKLIPCCPVPLCCRKTTTNNVFAIINQGIDQRELDMMQAERVEAMRIENEKRARLKGQVEEVMEIRNRPSPRMGARAPAQSRPYGGARVGNPNPYNSGESRDPDGESYGDMATEATEDDGDMATEASHSFSGAGREGGYAPQPPPPGASYYDDDDMVTEDEETYEGSRDAEYEDEEAGKKKKKKKKK